MAKVDKWIEENGLKLIEGWARMGLTDQQISHNIGISRKTLSEWKKKYQQIDTAIQRGKKLLILKWKTHYCKKHWEYSKQ